MFLLLSRSRKSILAVTAAFIFHNSIMKENKTITMLYNAVHIKMLIDHSAYFKALLRLVAAMSEHVLKLRLDYINTEDTFCVLQETC